MNCFFPKSAICLDYINTDGELKKRLFFGLPKYPDDFADYISHDRIKVRCQKCIACCFSYSKAWAFRIMLESLDYDDNAFITLTYADEFCDGDLHIDHVQKFIKRLRKKISPVKVRVFYCGEYGSEGLRPHYHLVLFGYNFSDRYEFKRDKRGNLLYRSSSLEKLWKYGFSSIGDLTFESAIYVGKYLQKLQPVPPGRTVPFVHMSNRPGIAFSAILESMLDTDKIWYHGKYIGVPRFFLDKLKEICPDKVREVKEQRLLSMLFNYQSNEEVLKMRLLKKYGTLIAKPG